MESLGLILCLADNPFKSGFLGLFSRRESDPPPFFFMVKTRLLIVVENGWPGSLTLSYSNLKRLVYKA